MKLKHWIVSLLAGAVLGHLAEKYDLSWWVVLPYAVLIILAITAWAVVDDMKAKGFWPLDTKDDVKPEATKPKEKPRISA